MLITESAPTNVTHSQFVSMQLSYSTADLEKSIFYEEFVPIEENEIIGDATLLVIDGDLFVLEEEYFPSPTVPLTNKSGLFQIVGLDKKA